MPATSPPRPRTRSTVCWTRPPLVTTSSATRTFLTRLDRKTALQDQLAVLLVRENRADSERTGDLLADDQAADRRRDHRLNPLPPELIGEEPADRFGLVRVLQKQSGLKEAAAVQSAAKLKVAGQKRTGIFQNFDDFLFRHGEPFLLFMLNPDNRNDKTALFSVRRHCKKTNAGSFIRRNPLRPDLPAHGG